MTIDVDVTLSRNKIPRGSMVAAIASADARRMEAILGTLRRTAGTLLCRQVLQTELFSVDIREISFVGKAPVRLAQLCSWTLDVPLFAAAACRYPCSCVNS